MYFRQKYFEAKRKKQAFLLHNMFANDITEVERHLIAYDAIINNFHRLALNYSQLHIEEVSTYQPFLSKWVRSRVPKFVVSFRKPMTFTSALQHVIPRPIKNNVNSVLEQASSSKTQACVEAVKSAVQMKKKLIHALGGV